MLRKLLKRFFGSGQRVDTAKSVIAPLEPTHPPGTTLQPDIKELQELLKPLAKPCIKITAKDLKIAFNDDPLSLTVSKFGGMPFLPEGATWPRGENNQPTLLLAQINFNELPDFPEFPEDGLLQIFTERSFEDYDCKPIVIYRTKQEMEAPSAPKSTLYFDMPEYHFETVHQLSFESAIDPGCYQDERFANRAADIFKTNGFADLGDDVNDAIYDIYHGGGHKIGGYAEFTQEDPRAIDDPSGYSFLQIDSQDGIMIGDCGIIHLFLDPKQIKPGKINGGWYYWDCC